MFKKLSILIAGVVVGSALVVQSASAASLAERELVVSVNDAFIPDGFDTESDAFAVVSGLFPNGCYSFKQAQVKHDYKSLKHEVRTVARVSEGACIMVLVPFTKEVRLGKLPRGENSIRFINGDGTYMEKKVVIE